MDKERKSLREEIRQGKPFRSAAEEGVLNIWRTADYLKRRVGAVIEERGITLQQYNVLRILRGAGDKGLPTLEIGERMIERAPGVTRLMDRLEAKRMIRRERCPHDRRQVLCYITAQGLLMVDSLDDPVDESVQLAMKGLARKELEQLIEYLERLRAEA